MTGPARSERAARAALTCLAEPGDEVMGALLRTCTPAEIVTALTEGRAPSGSVALGTGAAGWASNLFASPGPGHGIGRTGAPLRPVPADGESPPGKAAPAAGSGSVRHAGKAPAPASQGSPPQDTAPHGTAAQGTALQGTALHGTAPQVSPPHGTAAQDSPPQSTERRVGDQRLRRALARWAARLGDIPPEGALDAWQRDGIRLIIPGDPEWPGQLDVLNDARPWGLWVRGDTDLRFACLRSVSMVGTRAATAYGAYVCNELATGLAERGWTVVSGGAYGIDGCAHRGALAGNGTTIAVMPCGVDLDYPPGHGDLFRGIREHGATISEWPPGRTPTKHGFLVRNRVIAALSRGTVIVEAALRSGALNTARHAHEQGRPLMAVPGPVTSAQSAGCHEAIREWAAVCVTGVRDVLEQLTFLGDEAVERPPSPVLPRDMLDPVTSRVLEAVPARAGGGPARIAVAAGVELDTVMSCLGALAAAGFVERCARGWRIRRSAEE